MTDWLDWTVASYRPKNPLTGMALQHALARFNATKIPVGDRGGFYIPIMHWGATGFGLHDRLAFVSMLPPGSAVGPLVNRSLFRLLGKRNGAAYRAYLWLCCNWNRHGASHGRLIRPNRQAVKRDARERLLDERGEVITGKGGKAILSNWHSRAVLTGSAEWNPHRSKYPAAGREDIL